MAQTAADILIDVLQEWGVDTIFGLPGDGINGIMEALRAQGRVGALHSSST
jgi:pyruvate dehydrogenase (quinone)/pyruvate oxidase